MSAAVRYLSGLRKYGVRPSLERIQEVLAVLGRPDRHYSTVLITGTNGKGTCAKALAEILRLHGVQVGLYMSPHLFSYTERYEVNGKKIAAYEFEQEVAVQRSILAAVSARLTEFEFLTLLAFRIFSQRRVSWAVVEIGMGGRWDAANVADPKISVITSVGIDHTEFLGRTVGRIAFDKAHIARENRDLLVGPVPSAARNAIERVASKIGAHAIFLRPENIRPLWKSALPAHIFGPSFELAIRSARSVLGTKFRISKSQSAIGRSALPGRYEMKTYKGRRIIFDVAHNEPALGIFFEQLRKEFPFRRLEILIGMQRQKLGEETILRHLSPRDSVRLVRLSIPRSKPPDLWRPFIRRARRCGIRVYPLSKMRSAFQAALRSVRSKDILVVTGSFHTVREALRICG